MEITRFDPFNIRLCRDIRNNLSDAFMKALKLGTMKPANEAAAAFDQMNLAPICNDYINNRLTGYQKALAASTTSNLNDSGNIYLTASHIWNQELFFEVHDYLEQCWMKSSGDEKLILQALIRAAGTYVHLEQGNTKGARGMADKAIPPLLRLRDKIPEWINLDLLVNKLRNLDPIPPKFHNQ